MKDCSYLHRFYIYCCRSTISSHSGWLLHLCCLHLHTAAFKFLSGLCHPYALLTSRRPPCTAPVTRKVPPHGCCRARHVPDARAVPLKPELQARAALPSQLGAVLQNLQFGGEGELREAQRPGLEPQQTKLYDGRGRHLKKKKRVIGIKPLHYIMHSSFQRP